VKPLKRAIRCQLAALLCVVRTVAVSIL